MILLIGVSFVVIWLRFQLGAHIILFGWRVLGTILEAHGHRTLFNGQPARQNGPVIANRHERRRAKALRRKA